MSSEFIMNISINQTSNPDSPVVRCRWYDRIWASLIFFTRLPFWRIHQPPKECYKTVVEHWPMTGWITGGVMGVVIYFGTLALPAAVAILLAIVIRILITGALHEDGLADFFDGFGGGGKDRQRILDIMKDSHIGTYGVLGLVLYIAILTTAISSIPPFCSALLVAVADPFSKMVTSQLILMMPYARSEEDAKSKTVYRKFGVGAGISLAIQGLLPISLFIFIMDLDWQVVIFIPAIVFYFLYLLIWRRLRGYTGDCCGAVCLLVELTVYVIVAAINHMNPL